MKVINKKANRIKRKEFYTIKTCSCCNQQIELNNGDILDAADEGNNRVSIICPECGSKVMLNRYFSGKKYTPNQYLTAANKVESIIWDILHEIGEIDRGYGTDYIDVNMIWLIVDPMRVEFKVYINRYEEGNWNHRIGYSEFYKSMMIDITDYFCLDNLDEYAAYAQAIRDYAVEKMAVSVPNGYYPHEPVLFEKELLNYFRGGDSKITLSKLSSKKYGEVKHQNYRDAHTLFLPETDEKLQYIGESVDKGLQDIAAAIPLAGGGIIENNTTVVNRFYGW